MAARQRLKRGDDASEPKPAARSEELFDRLLHDLRNPVGVIAYYAEAISGAGTSERDELSERLRVNAQRALHVLDEFSLLGELRSGPGRPAREPCDVGELVAEQVAVLEALERRPGRLRCKVTIGGPVRASRLQLTCAVRALLRVALRATATEDAVQLAVRAGGGDLVFEISVALRSDPEFGVVGRLPSTGIEIELAERVAALHDGHCTIAQESGRGVMTLVLRG